MVTSQENDHAAESAWSGVGVGVGPRILGPFGVELGLGLGLGLGIGLGKACLEREERVLEAGPSDQGREADADGTVGGQGEPRLGPGGQRPWHQVA